MANEERNGSPIAAERKRILIEQGAAYRTGINNSRAAVRTNLSAEALAKNAISHVVLAAFTALKSGAILRGGNLQILLPLVVSGISKLSKKSLLKPVARGALVVAAVAAITRFIVKRKKAGKAQEQ